MTLLSRPLSAQRSAIPTLYAGMALTVAALGVAWLDHATANLLASHIRAGYPQYTQTHINAAATTYLVYLSVIAVVSLIGWGWTLQAVKRGKRWTRPVATTIFLIGVGVLLADLLIKDTSGARGLPTLLGCVGLSPTLPGLLVVCQLWRDRPS
jgi:hypothetical protein